ncbi:MAG TPA: 16S rRNA (cytidine(1402)-2'-O)-methyltransferase [Candidatus Coprocola pullicola]|nr:16S rRNA (cytidine(1402)-2'-O)-methyltransferase [Candidatus Coprocola pullicola]
MSGTVYLCGTPIGNLQDMSLRVLNILKTVDFIAAEDTRHTLQLLNHFEITTPMTSYHEHNKQTKGIKLIERVQKGENMALVTDAGMPGISDPGADFVKLCYEKEIAVTVVPGASAVITALVLSGLDTRRFVFEGFLPSEKKQRRTILQTLQKEHRTMVLYEAPHRLVHTLQELSEIMGKQRIVATIKELTKKYEQVRKDTIQEQIAYYSANPPKGEFVLVIEGFSLEEQKRREQQSWEKLSIAEHLQQYIQKGISEKEAMKQVAKDRGVSKREIYAVIKNKEV